jgi:hypothetical protein
MPDIIGCRQNVAVKIRRVQDGNREHILAQQISRAREAGSTRNETGSGNQLQKFAATPCVYAALSHQPKC